MIHRIKSAYRGSRLPDDTCPHRLAHIGIHCCGRIYECDVRRFRQDSVASAAQLTNLPHLPRTPSLITWFPKFLRWQIIAATVAMSESSELHHALLHLNVDSELNYPPAVGGGGLASVVPGSDASAIAFSILSGLGIGGLLW